MIKECSMNNCLICSNDLCEACSQNYYLYKNSSCSQNCYAAAGYYESISYEPGYSLLCLSKIILENFFLFIKKKKNHYSHIMLS